MKILDKVEELIEEADIHSFEKNNYRTIILPENWTKKS